MPNTENSLPEQQKLVQTLYSRLQEDNAHAELIETHISYILLLGDFAYKIKKVVNFGFLDYSTLELRKHYCEEEVHLNNRLASGLYLDVVAITIENGSPCLGGTGEPCEYAVRMHRFPDTAQLDKMLQAGKLKASHIDELADRIASFHAGIPAAGNDTDYGSAVQAHKPVQENFRQIRERITNKSWLEQLEKIETWSEQEFAKCVPLLEQRKKLGFIRHCHGDLHLGNVAIHNGQVIVFDCIEFNPSLYWIDVISEIAFCCMDLEDHRRPDLAYRFLNRYLEHTGDYAGLQVFRYYLAYRAMVRAKVACIRAEQGGTARNHALLEFEKYLQQAAGYTISHEPLLLITHGLSGSGKTYISRMLAEQLPAIHLRSDVERKRLFSQAGQHTSTEFGAGIYTPDATEKTYQRLQDLGAMIVAQGISAIIDATFLDKARRDAFHIAANKAHARFCILDLYAPEEVLRERILQRSREKSDISDADIRILEHQLSRPHALDPDETAYRLLIDTTAPDLERIITEQVQSIKKPLE